MWYFHKIYTFILVKVALSHNQKKASRLLSMVCAAFSFNILSSNTVWCCSGYILVLCMRSMMMHVYLLDCTSVHVCVCVEIAAFSWPTDCWMYVCIHLYAWRSYIFKKMSFWSRLNKVLAFTHQRNNQSFLKMELRYQRNIVVVNVRLPWNSVF